LWVSIYEEDEEACTLWRKLGVPEGRIRRFGQHENFWPANAPKEGPNGPCGPCSEIYFDAEGKVGGPKSVEVWNLVFTQYDRQPDGSLKALPKPNIDTGMGLERLASVVQGTDTDYETDLFAPIMAAIRALGRGEKVRLDRVLFAERTIADHIRAIVFLIAEGVVPSNESRGYVLRMLIRRAYRLGRTDLNLYTSTTRTFLTSLVESVEEAMRGSPYSAMLEKQRDVIRRAIRHEEMQFVGTLEAGTTRLEELIASVRGKTIAGDEAFKLYDTYGFPLELTIDIAQERGFTVDRTAFEALLKAQQERSRKGSQFGGEVFVPTTLTLKDVAKSEFVGYDALQTDATIKGIWKAGQWVQQAAQPDEIGIILDRSPFYGESGGQVGDQGTIESPRGAADVVDTTWADELLVHHAKVRQGTIAVGEPVRATVDTEHRLKVARSHTATHLLHWALRKVLGPETVQAGSLVEAERVRFDFSALGSLREGQWVKVERLVNERIRNADDVKTDLMDLERAKQAGALALFGEKYTRRVRVVSIGDYSKELCGGTHLRHTGSIGLFRLASESSIAAGTRRVEAVVGETALARQQEESQTLRQIAQQLSRSPQEALQGLEELMQHLKHAEKQLKTLKLEFAQAHAKRLVAEAKHVDGITVVAAQLDGADRELLSALADAIRGSLREGIALLVSREQPDSVAWVMAVSPTLVKRGLHAGQLLKAIAAVTQGGGGGRPEFAQAGGKDPAKIPDALQEAEQLIRTALGRSQSS
ncbi:MAG: alanine--tRNA ligase, partial [Candidatus Omnitrophica bacterium]|nr:alanine--tRNA ligase [Candidatus Omnitrophota bacterium]